MMLGLVLVAVSVACFCCAVRAFIGPTIPDRVVAIDAMTSLMIAALVVLGVRYRAAIFLDVAMVYALLAFVGTLVVSKYLERRGSET